MDLTTCLPRGWLGDEGFPVASPCPCGLTGAPSEHHRPGCDRTAHPQLDDETLALVNAAVESLARRRGSAPGDAGATLSCLASLIAEAQSRLPDAVAAARDQACTWSDIAVRLATTAPTARRRYCGYVRWASGLAAGGA